MKYLIGLVVVYAIFAIPWLAFSRQAFAGDWPEVVIVNTCGGLAAIAIVAPFVFGLVMTAIYKVQDWARETMIPSMTQFYAVSFIVFAALEITLIYAAIACIGANVWWAAIVFIALDVLGLLGCIVTVIAIGRGNL